VAQDEILAKISYYCDLVFFEIAAVIGVIDSVQMAVQELSSKRDSTPLVVTQFTGTASSSATGQLQWRLTWAVQGATSVSIEGVATGLAETGNLSITPAVGSPLLPSYTLTATNDAGETAAATIRMNWTIAPTSLTLPLSGGYCVAVSTDGPTALVASALQDNSGHCSIYVIDVPGQSLQRTITVATPPGGIAITPDGKTAVVTNTGANTVSLIDIASGTVQSYGPSDSSGNALFSNPQGIAITPDGKTALVVNAAPSQTPNPPSTWVTLIALPSATSSSATFNKVDLASASQWIALSHDGTFAVVPGYYVDQTTGNHLSGIWQIQVASGSGTVTKTIQAGVGPVVITPDGSTAVIAEQTNGTLFTVDLSAGTYKYVAAIPNSTATIAITPDGLTALLADPAYNLYLVDLRSLTVTNLIQHQPINSAVPLPVVGISTDGGTGFVADFPTSSVSVVGLSSTATGSSGTAIQSGIGPIQSITSMIGTAGGTVLLCSVNNTIAFLVPSYIPGTLS
jgi:DNA-binding beta-propeller fold protein YncE